MTDISYQNWAAMSDQAFTGQIGTFVQHHRLRQNKTQAGLARAAGISRSTLSLLERGETVTLATLIQVLRVLDQLHVMSAFVVQPEVSPMALLREQSHQRYRARGHRTDTDTPPTDW